MASSVTMYTLGVGDAFTTRHFNTHVMLDIDGREIFLDCPPYLPKMLAENKAKGHRSIDHTQYREILITHMHADHVNGLEELAYLQYYKTENPIKLYAPNWLLSDIWTSLRPSLEDSARGDGGLASFDWYFDPKPILSPQEFDGFTVSFTETRHHPRCLMYKFDFGGFKLAYAPDAGFDTEKYKWFDDCDLVLHDAWFGPTHALGADIRNLHSPVSDLLTMPREFQEKVLMCHYADDAYEDDPEQPSQDIGGYRLLKQFETYKLV